MAAAQGLVLFFSVGLALPAFAQCAVGTLDSAPPAFSGTLPAPPDPALRPARPACLTGLSGPEQENCPRGEIARYGAEVDAWVDALNAYVEATNRYANGAAAFANASVAHARAARAHADQALDFARCEAAVIAGEADE